MQANVRIITIFFAVCCALGGASLSTYRTAFDAGSGQNKAFSSFDYCEL